MARFPVCCCESGSQTVVYGVSSYAYAKSTQRPSKRIWAHESVTKKLLRTDGAMVDVNARLPSALSDTCCSLINTVWVFDRVGTVLYGLAHALVECGECSWRSDYVTYSRYGLMVVEYDLETGGPWRETGAERSPSVGAMRNANELLPPEANRQLSTPGYAFRLGNGRASVFQGQYCYPGYPTNRVPAPWYMATNQSPWTIPAQPEYTIGLEMHGLGTAGWKKSFQECDDFGSEFAPIAWKKTWSGNVEWLRVIQWLPGDIDVYAWYPHSVEENAGGLDSGVRSGMRVPAGVHTGIHTESHQWQSHSENWQVSPYSRTDYLFQREAMAKRHLLIPQQDGSGFTRVPMPMGETDQASRGIYTYYLDSFTEPPYFEVSYQEWSEPQTSRHHLHYVYSEYDRAYPLQHNTVDGKCWCVRDSGMVMLYENGGWREFGNVGDKLDLSAGLIQLADGTLLGIRLRTDSQGYVYGKLMKVSFTWSTKTLVFSEYMPDVPELLLEEPDGYAVISGYHRYSNWRLSAVQFALDDAGVPVFAVSQHKDQKYVQDGKWSLYDSRCQIWRKVDGQWLAATVATGVSSSTIEVNGVMETYFYGKATGGLMP